MEFLVVSDTHGRVEKVVKYAKGRAFTGIIHAGDYYRDGIFLGSELGIPVYAVYGNCDGVWDGIEEETIEISGKRIFLTHGHSYYVKHDLKLLAQKAESLKAELVIFGHSHVPVYTRINGLWFLNPGSPSLPREGKGGSVAILKILEEGFEAEIVYL
ncbi:metallophosphoesterase family protein [Carboxydothermus pertinax]|uniref:Phosphoesterase n=1 Tax=Carboxydothermus pertinax TaxID=870242 RepID=A0A1L8CRV4_9THEO|nr:metallophosphoesterase [Carboxydothermus pertinax]GAV21652.1 phosphoesterase [Carboxydothermus pertinax]